MEIAGNSPELPDRHAAQSFPGGQISEQRYTCTLCSGHSLSAYISSSFVFVGWFVDTRSKVTLQTSFRVLHAGYIDRIIICM